MGKRQSKAKGGKGKQTPLMRQYAKIKEKHPNAVLLFRMGDFYETFDEDAVLVSRLLGITLTKRANGKASDVPLAGFPHHALDSYLPKLVQAGHRVAICEQLEDPKYARKIVKRGVVEVVTPGVSFHDHMLDPKHGNYLAAVHWGSGKETGRVGVAFADATTGEFSVAEMETDRLDAFVQSIAPAEVLFDRRNRKQVEGMKAGEFVTTAQEDWAFGLDFAYETLLRHFKTHSLKGFGVDHMRLGLVAAGAVIHYLGETQKGRLPHIRRIGRFETGDYIALDPETKRNLELVSSMREGGRDGSLIQILDETKTPMGGRLLRQWLLRPVRNAGVIEERLDAVEELFGSRVLREQISGVLAQIGDLERLIARICLKRANPRDLAALASSLEQIPAIVRLLDNARAPTLDQIGSQTKPCPEVVEMVRSALVDDPPAHVASGGTIREGFSTDLDELREIASSGKQFLGSLQAEEIKRTGIHSLKVGFNRVFGYYIEVTNAHREKVPDDYVRKQTLVNAERYITPRLKEYEEKILTAEEQMGRLEQDLFETLRDTVAGFAETIQNNAGLIAVLDVLTSFAVVAEKHRYVRPQITDGLILDIEEGRHPVVEATLPPGEPFIPNSISLDQASEQILIVTGPNMAGKSVVLRQVGLIVLMAQVGSFVPAQKATIGVVDKIFTRVGASDNLAAGESTFLVEMNETANILNNATPRSLILFDEVGRGTSTFDGLSIAWAIVEYLHEHAAVASRVLFATHYHELNALAERYERVRNARIQVREHDGKVIFLRKLVPGGADHSYGIEVARMAGLPMPVVERARAVLQHLEDQRMSVGTPEDNGRNQDEASRTPDVEKADVAGLEAPENLQMTLFAQDPGASEIRRVLSEVDPNRLTPLEALMKLAEIKRLLEE